MNLGIGSAAVLVLASLAVGCGTVGPDCSETGCAANQVCDAAGQCRDVPSCESSEDCAGGGLCVRGVCAGCATGAACTFGYVACDFGANTCVPCSNDGQCPGAQPQCRSNQLCVECTEDADCPSGRPKCESNVCGDCHADADCAAGSVCRSGTCSPACSEASDCPGAQPHCWFDRCYQCIVDKDCAANEECAAGRCTAATPGTTCRAPYDVDFSTGTALILGDITQTLGTSWEGSVLASTVVYYRIRVEREGLLNGNFWHEGTSFNWVFGVLRAPCDDIPHGATQPAPGGPMLRDLYVPPGDYVVWVAPQARVQSESGPFALHLWLSPGTRQPGNDCLKTIPVTLDAEGRMNHHASLSSSLVEVAARPCVDAQVADPGLIYEFDLPFRGGFDVTATPTAGNLDVRVMMETRCGFAAYYPEICAPDEAPGERLGTSELPAGKYFVLVQAEEGTTGEADVRFHAEPWAENDDCETAPLLDLADGSATATGNTRFSQGLTFYCACQSIDCSTNEVAYQLDTTGMGIQDVVLEVTTTSTEWTPQLSLSTSCDSNGDSHGCTWETTTGNTARIVANRLPPGVYFIQLAGPGRGGPYTLNVTATPSLPIPSNDTCDAPLPLDLSSGSGSVAGDTSGAYDEHTDSCGTVATRGYDVVYEVLRPTGRGRVNLTLTPEGSTWDPVLKLQWGSCAPWNYDDGCSASGTPGAAESVSFLSYGGQDYFAIVDGAEAAHGRFNLSGAFMPSPAHDVCAGAVDLGALPLTAPVSGDTTNSYTDLTSNCFSDLPGADLFYRFSFAAPNSRPTTVTVTPQGFDVSFYILSGTDCAFSLTCGPRVNAAGAGLAETLTFSALKNTTYWIVVDAVSGSGGAFTLEVE